LILKALSKEIEDRYPTGAALSEALEQALQAKAIDRDNLIQVEDIEAKIAKSQTESDRVAVELGNNPINQAFGKYRLAALLGQGGMARVYKAYDPLSRFVAIKILHNHLAQQEDFVERFHSEAATVAALNHPNIVHIYDFGVEQGQYYMAMAFVEGSTLETELEQRQHKRQQFSLIEIIHIFEDLARAIDYAHARGIVHRDLKPSNIMFTTDNRVVLTDFGIARLMDTTKQTATGVFLGTLTYASPEQVQGKEIDQRSDIYSLGIILYELLTGQVPYKDDNPLALMMKHIHESPLLPSNINPDLSETVDQIILKALHKNPDERYQTAREIVRAIEAAFIPQRSQTKPKEAINKEQAMKPTVFISYSHKDEKEKDELMAHLGILHHRAQAIEVWVDDQIEPGTDWTEEIERAISRAKVAILLVTSNFRCCPSVDLMSLF
jgi:serine/threonine protein kinase